MTQCPTPGCPNRKAYVSLLIVECGQRDCWFYPRTQKLPKEARTRVMELWAAYDDATTTKDKQRYHEAIEQVYARHQL